MQDGTTVQLRIFINGYVICEAGAVKIDSEIAKKFFDATEMKGQFSKVDIDESKYIVITPITILNKIYTFVIMFALVITGIAGMVVVRIIIRRKKLKEKN